MLTDRKSDFMSFTFTGTGVSVIGTVGVRQGLINFYLDGTYLETFDRGRPKLVCDQVLFELSDLPLEEHTIVALLDGTGINPNTGKEDGVLSIQRVKYTAPDDPVN
ncbi:hypothetical protein FRC01_000281 [Tulasnella sp. 417]|nr:hypothetical protein FRC01_000281 [Tulasnella sp. 417]